MSSALKTALRLLIVIMRETVHEELCNNKIYDGVNADGLEMNDLKILQYFYVGFANVFGKNNLEVFWSYFRF